MKIRQISLFIALLGLLFSLSNCRTHGPAFSANANSYMAKPVYRGENEGAFYLSGRLNNGYEYYDHEDNNSGELSAHLSFMSRYFFLSGGFFSYWGKYKVNPAVNPVTGGGMQPFNGGGLRTEIGARIPLEKKFELLVGLNGEAFREGGKYAENSSNVFADIFTFGLNRVQVNVAPALDLRFTPAGKWSGGLRYSFDTYFTATDLYEDNSNSYLQRLTLHTSYDRFTLYGQLGFTPDQQRVGSIGLAYGIPFKKREKE